MNAIRRGRRTFVTLFLVCLALAAGSTFLGARALEEAEVQAQITAKGLANAGVASVLVPDDVSGTIGGDAARDLLSRLQRGVLVDGTAFRVRVWSPSGDLLFSTDAADAPDAVSADLDSVYAATRSSGKIESVRSSDDQVFATFVPLRLGQERSLGAVEVDQGYERIATGAASPWSLLRFVGAVGAALSLLFAGIASLPNAGSRSGGFITPGRPRTRPQGAQADEGMSRAEERAKAAEERAVDIERRAHDAQTREREAEVRAAHAEAGLEVAHDEIERLRGAAAETGAAETAAGAPDAEALVRIESLEQELARAHMVRTEAEQAAREASARAVELAEGLRAAEAAAQRDRVAGDELASVRTAESERRLTESEHRVAKAEEQLAQTQEQLAQTQEQLEQAGEILTVDQSAIAEAQRRVAAAEQQAADAESRAAAAEKGVAEARGLADDERSKVAEMGTEAAGIQQQIATLEASLDEERSAKADLERTLSAITDETEAERSRGNQAESRASQAEARAARALGEKGSVEGLVAQLEGQLLTANGSMAAFEVRIADAEARASDADARVNSIATELAEQQAQTHREQRRHEALTAELESVRAGSAQLVETARVDSAKLVESARAEARGLVETAQGEARERIEADRAEIRGRLADLEASLAEAEGRVRAAEEKVAAAGRRADEGSLAVESARADVVAAVARAEEAERVAAGVDETLRQAEVRVREAEAASEAARATKEVATARADEAELAAAERFEAADSLASDVERGAHELEVRLAEATASAQAFKTEATEATWRAEAAEERAESEITAARAEAKTATERARAEAVDAVRRATGSATMETEPSDASPNPDTQELENEIARLEGELKSMTGRLRHANAQIESSSGPATMPIDDESGVPEGEGTRAALSLRSRLAQTAARKKGDKFDKNAGFGQ